MKACDFFAEIYHLLRRKNCWQPIANFDLAIKRNPYVAVVPNEWPSISGECARHELFVWASVE